MQGIHAIQQVNKPFALGSANDKAIALIQDDLPSGSEFRHLDLVCMDRQATLIERAYQVRDETVLGDRKSVV